MSVKLNPCAVNFDPGFVDRIYMLMFYAELDPGCLMTPAIGLLHDDEADGPEPSMSVAISCPQLELNFYVPKVDMRKPDEMSREEFVASFWARQIHPEVLQLRLKNFDMSVGQDAGPKSPLTIAFASDFIEIFFKEDFNLSDDDSSKVRLCVARKSLRNAELPHKKAGRISVTVCMDDSLKLQGKFDSTERRKNPRGSSGGGGPGGGVGGGGFDFADQFFGAAASSGDVRAGGMYSRSNYIVEEQANIKAALEHSLRHNNIMVDVFFDEVSLVLPNKHIYELIYNRLGNDLLLWLPSIFSVKDVLYNQQIPDPLQDPDMGFSKCYSG